MNVVYKTLPKHTEEKVPLDQIIEIYFMIDINKQSIRDEHIILLNLTEQRVEPVTFDYNRRILKITPVSKLTPLNHYQLQILGGTNGIKDITGRTMAQTYEVEFQTKDVDSIKPPDILTPTDLSIVREAVSVELEPNLDADYYELQISKSNTFHILEWPVNGEKVYRTTEIKVIPDVAYQTGQYFMRVRSVGFDETVSAWSPVIRFYYDGVPTIVEPIEESMPDEVVQQEQKVILQAMTRFKEQPTQLSQLQKVFSSKAEEMQSPLLIKSVTPKDKSVNNKIASSKQIIIGFTSDIDPATVTSSTCYILSERN